MWVDKVTLLDGTPIFVAVNDDVSPTAVQPCGVLGTYLSEAKARKIGKAWIYDQLMDLGVHIDLPLPTQDGYVRTEAAWRRSEWRRTADGSWGYSISDYSPSWLALVVYITERVIDDSDDEEEYQDSDDEA